MLDVRCLFKKLWVPSTDIQNTNIHCAYFGFYYYCSGSTDVSLFVHCIYKNGKDKVVIVEEGRGWALTNQFSNSHLIFSNCKVPSHITFLGIWDIQGGGVSMNK